MQPVTALQMQNLNATMRKFGAPQTIIVQYQSLVCIVRRPAQATLGALVLAAHEPAQALSELSPGSFAELHKLPGNLNLR